jgi:lipopolysaccharide heptosyltransferase I
VARPIPERILIIRPSSLGDVVRTVPVLVSLRRAYPKARIDWLVNDRFLPAVEHHPDLSRAIPFPRQRVGEQVRHLKIADLYAWARANLREARYDLVLDVQGLARSGIMAWLTRAPRRVGFSDARELGWLGLNERVRMPEGLHHVDRYLHVLRAMGIEPVPDLRLYPAADDRSAVASDERLGGRYVVLSPATRGLGRAWPIDRYAALASELLVNAGAWGIDRVVVVGLANERVYCGPITSRSGTDERVVDLVGSTSIGRLMAVLERAALIVCNDSAAMHMAVAFGRPMVALLGPTKAETSGPYGRSEDVLSGWRPEDAGVRHRDVERASAIMRRIELEDVVRACGARLASGLPALTNPGVAPV